MRETSLVLMVLFLSFPRLAIGQKSADSIVIGSIELRLGMEKDVVIGKLAQQFEVKPAGGAESSSWVISRKQGPPYEAQGSVTFSGEKLSTIMKYWNPESGQTEVSLAQGLFGAVSQLVEEGKTLCTIETCQKDSPSVESKTVFLSCGRKYLRIDITRSKTYGDSASISEVLSER